jgi:glyoxylase-like metal-dependent hydrolase (beta-lactamase superfamily II)
MTDLAITCLEIGRLSLTLASIYRLPRGYPQRNAELAFPIYCFHLQLPGRSVLVDAAAYDAESIPAHFLLPHYEPPPPLPEQLQMQGINPETITDLIITHTHFDHYNGISRLVDGRPVLNFPQARHYLGAEDWKPANFGKLEKHTLKLAHEEDLLTLVEQPLELGNGLTILPAPGETPGHQILHLSHQGEHAYFVGDLYHHPLEFVQPSLNVKWADEGFMQTSKEMLIQHAASVAAQVYFAHIPGPYRVKKEGDGFDWQPTHIEQSDPANRENI